MTQNNYCPYQPDTTDIQRRKLKEFMMYIVLLDKKLKELPLIRQAHAERYMTRVMKGSTEFTAERVAATFCKSFSQFQRGKKRSGTGKATYLFFVT